MFLFRRFNTFHLEASSSCQFDSVAVYDGPDTLSPLLGKFCGTVLPPNLRSSTNQLFIVFRTDNSVSGIGWRATYSQTLGRWSLLCFVFFFILRTSERHLFIKLCTCTTQLMISSDIQSLELIQKKIVQLSVWIERLI